MHHAPNHQLRNLTMMKFLSNIFAGPTPLPRDSLCVQFYMKGGQIVSVHGVKKLTVSKAAEGGFASYSIEWHVGFKPALLSLTLDDISAIHATEET